jgi:bacterioferritin (cytochrome b1)
MNGDPQVIRQLDEYLSFELTGHRRYDRVGLQAYLQAQM